MPSFPDVVKGQKFTPSVALENAVRHMVNASQPISGGSSSKLSSVSRLLVYNNDTIPLVQGAAVNFDADGEICDQAVPCSGFSDARRPYGVITSYLDIGELGSCIISGPVKVRTNGAFGDYALPNASGLRDTFTPGVKGSPVIFQWEEDDEHFAIINLGGSSTLPMDEYIGQFKITALSLTQASITFPGSTTYCGLTDVPGCEQVPPAEITVPEGQQNIYITFKFESPAKYSCRFAAGTNPPADADLFQVIGTFNNGYVVQGVNITNGRLTFGNDWYL